MISKNHQNNDVFINCPFNEIEYTERLEAIVFTIHYCGYRARCAMEQNDSGAVRIQKLFKIIEECRLGIHDISFVQLDKNNNLPRFNMPLELGMFLGAKHFGNPRQQEKITLILDSEQYRYQIFCSDIAGQDIRSHDNSTDTVIKKVRQWLRADSSAKRVPGESTIRKDYSHFCQNLSRIAETLGMNVEEDELQFNDLTTAVVEWLRLYQ